MATTTKRYKKYWLYIKITGMIVMPLALIILPGDFFDAGRDVCLSKLLLDIECYGCGMTRAIMHIIHLDFGNAWLFNKISFIVFPIISYLWAKEFLKDINFIRSNDI
jgi:hypothetical protein